MFNKEADFEKALIDVLSQKGWEEKVIKNPTEKDLLENWKSILFENNRGIDRLNEYPLTDGEMAQILDQITALRTPLKLNGFINGKTVAITRDNTDDELHFGTEISLKIYDRHEIAAGQSRYQIVQQPVFKTANKIMNDRRGDLLLLINGMPVIHIELKKSGVSVSQAYNQIEKYSHENIFTGLFSLVQIFVAMEPNETVYFANPGPDGTFNKNYYFHWADFNNEPINNWKDIASNLLSIPMAHQLIGFYTVADNTDGVLKVMRSYQYYAANAISDKVSKTKWDDCNIYGGYIWHTTGSGKTMTSFKSAQLIANSKDADKVLFLMDRIELGTQSLQEYQGFADESESVQGTENTGVLITKIKDSSPANILIVTSIQKMSNIKKDCLNSQDLELMNSKRIVFIIDEAHRSTFGDMLVTIKETFPGALFFGFTGTPIQEENQKKMSTTSSIFGNELHRYSIADGIRDKNVLGFDPYKVLTYKDTDVRREVALQMAKASTEEEAIKDPDKNKLYYTYMDSSQIKMASYVGQDGKIVKGIEDYIPHSQYRTEAHQKSVVTDILENWMRLSHNGKFHALFATSSIPEAIAYYRLIKQTNPELKITALFDSNIDNNGNVQYKEDGLIEIMQDYNERYEQDFTIATHAKFKKDITARLAHKEPYLRIERTPEKQIDLLIVVDQLLTGFDSKWLNTLYLDKMLQYENIIQAFSRTNRLFGPEKPFGTIRYYRKPHTMEENIKKAVKLYSGDKPLGLFVQRLSHNLTKMNVMYEDIADLFTQANSKNFEKLPEDNSEKGKFAKQFSELTSYLEAAKIQGFTWDQRSYEADDEAEDDTNTPVELKFDETTYLTLVQRYKELFAESEKESPIDKEEITFEIDSYITEIDTDTIDSDYMNTRFQKFLKILKTADVDEAQVQQTLDELHKSFATLNQEEQKYAEIFLRDVQRGDAKLDSNKSFKEYIAEYQSAAKNTEIKKITYSLGLDESKLRGMLVSDITASNINDYGRFDELKESADIAKAKAYFEKQTGKQMPMFKVHIAIDKLLKDYITKGEYE